MALSHRSYTKLDHPDVLKFVFHPRKEEHPSAVPGSQDHAIPVADGVTIGARFFLGRQEDPNVLFFHGNGEIVSDYDSAGPVYVRHGLSLLAVDYRGYGRSGGSPSVSAVMEDAHQIFRFVRDWLKKEGRNGPLIVMGRSLGSACAIDLAAAHKEEVAGLVVESGFAKTLPLLRCIGVDTEALGLTEADGFGNLEKIGQYPKPTLIIHARHDQIIPAVEAEVLQVECAAKSKEFQMIPGADHNTVMVQTGEAYFELIKRFADKIEGKRPKHRSFREKREERRQH